MNPLDRVALWMSRDKFAMLSKRLKLLKMDYGDSFDIEYSEGEHETRLKVTSCFYENIFQEEKVPELTRSCCCSVDKLWFEGINMKKDVKVTFEQNASIADGDATCELVVKKQ